VPCGHYIPEEAPEALLEAALPFLRGWSPRGRRGARYPSFSHVTRDSSHAARGPRRRSYDPLRSRPAAWM